MCEKQNMEVKLWYELDYLEQRLFVCLFVCYLCAVVSLWLSDSIHRLSKHWRLVNNHHIHCSTVYQSVGGTASILQCCKK